MKYMHACFLKKLMRNLMGVNPTDAVRMRLVVAHVSKSAKDLWIG